MKAKVYVTLKAGVLDPQGKAVGSTLTRLGYDSVKDVRIGKFVEIELDAPSEEAAREVVAGMCKDLIANTVMEDFIIEIES